MTQYWVNGPVPKTRNWEVFFEGEEMQKRKSNHSGSMRLIDSGIRDVDMSEGNEEMVLVQDVIEKEEPTIALLLRKMGENKLMIVRQLENVVFMNICSWDFPDMFIRGGNLCS